MGQEFPNGEAVQVLYSAYGQPVAEKDPGSGTEYRRLNTVNGRGQPVQETYGNGMVLLPQYTSQTGQVTELKYMLGSGELRRLNYAYDKDPPAGPFLHARRRVHRRRGVGRCMARLQRLVSSIRSGAASGTTTYTYDVVGNFTSKSDFSTTAANAYTYTGGSCGGGPNAVKSIALAAGGTRTYCYDANGNLTSDNAGLSIRYDHMNMATQATRGSQTDTFRYGSDGKRTRSWGADGSRVYLPGYEHRTDTGETKVYVGDYAVITRTGTTRKVDYLLKDRLGSVDAVANAVGSITEAREYDPFGKPRDGTWADRTPATLTSRLTTPKGFTQHEHLDALELIHMNGRVFEYHMGRFTGVDPFIQFPLNSQSLNPYSYILNNPLSGTDPTGYKAVYQDPRNSVCGNSRCRQTIGGAGGVGRDREANPFNSEPRVIRADEYHGSVSNGASDGQQLHGRPLLATPEQLERSQRVDFTGEEHRESKWASLSAEEGARHGLRLQQVDERQIVTVSELNDANGYDDADSAAVAQQVAYDKDYQEARARNAKVELLGAILRNNGRYYFTTVVEVPESFEVELAIRGTKGSTVAALTHTHPATDYFSREDYRSPMRLRVPFYVRTPSGRMYRWDPEGARNFSRSLDTAQKSGSLTSLQGPVEDGDEFGIKPLCGGNPCVP